MVIISLDQNFYWDFHTKRHANAARLFTLIESAVKTHKALCPVHSNELVEEGSKAPSEKRSGIFRIATALCAGMAFRDFTQAVADETLQLVRPSYQPQRLIAGTLKLPEDIDDLGTKMRERLDDYEARRHQLSYLPRGFSESMDIWGIYHEIMKARLGSMVRLTKAVRDGRSLDVCPNEWEFTLGAARHLQMLGIRAEECERLITLICQRHWEQIPTMLRHSRLCAQLEVKMLKSTKSADRNDYFDLTRLAVGLTDADVVLCDKSMSNLIKATGFNAPPHFSWSTSNEAIRHLETLFQN